MTNQEAFDVMVRHLRKQGRKSHMSGRTVCMYRGPKGLRCAVGALIPDDEYSRDLEFTGAARVAEKVPSLQSLSIDLLEELQLIHDSDALDQWERGFVLAAKRFGLTVPTLESEVVHA